MTCDSATQPNSGTDYIVTNLHPNYEARIPIKDVQAVYNHKAEIPLEAYRDACLDIRRGWNTLVTPEDVQEASEHRYPVGDAAPGGRVLQGEQSLLGARRVRLLLSRGCAIGGRPLDVGRCLEGVAILRGCGVV